LSPLDILCDGPGLGMLYLMLEGSGVAVVFLGRGCGGSDDVKVEPPTIPTF